MIYPRFLAKFLAWLLGYFWAPCPNCGEPFAGFESGMEGIGGWVCCPKNQCQEAGRLDRQSGGIYLVGETIRGG
jgi:hypothetical protein